MEIEKIIVVSTTISTEDLIEQLSGELDEEEVFEFIKDLELKYSDWELTEKLFKYFKKAEMIKLIKIS